MTMRLKAVINSYLYYPFLILIFIFNCTSVKHKSNPPTADFHYNRGLEFLKVNDQENAEREFRFAVELDDHFAPAHLGLAVLKYNNKDYSTSEHHVDEAIKLKKHWADAYLLKSKILFQKEQYEEAFVILKQSEYVFDNGNQNNRKALKFDILLWRGLCLKNMGNYDMAAIEFAAALKIDPQNQIAGHAMEDIRLISEMTATYPQSVKNIINKKAISRSDWANLLRVGLSKEFILNTSKKNSDKIINLRDVASDEVIIKVVQKNLVNIYPDGEFKPDLDLSWAEVIITVKNILQSINNPKPAKLSEPPFSDLSRLHPLYNSATLATSLGIFKDLSQLSYRLSQPVKGMDALLIIANLNKVIDKSL